jgi:hypothetical protein
MVGSMSCAGFGFGCKKIVFAHWPDEFIKFPVVEEDMGDVEKEGNKLERQVRYVLREIFIKAFANLKSPETVAIIIPFAARFQRFDSCLRGEDLLSVDCEGKDDYRPLHRRPLELHVENFYVTVDDLWTLFTMAISLSPASSPLTSLTTTPSCFHNCNASFPAAFGIQDHTLAAQLPALKHLKQLRTHIFIDKGFTENSVLSDALNSMPELERLGLRFLVQREPPEGLLLPRFSVLRSLEDMYLQFLLRLSFVHVDVPEDVFKTFFSNHSKTSRWLELLNIQLLSAGRWRLVLQLLLDNAVVLEAIRFGQLRQSGALLAPSKAMEWWFQGSIQDYRTRQGVVDGLTWFSADMLLMKGKYPEYTSAPA